VTCRLVPVACLALALVVPVRGDDGAASLALAVQAPTEAVVAGRPFAVAVTLSWKGGPTAWVPKVMDGPALTQVREVGHGVTASAMQGSDGPSSRQVHEFTFVADAAGTAGIGAIEFRLVAQGGEERVLATKALHLPVTTSWSQDLGGAWAPWVAGAVAGLLFLLVGIVVHRRRRAAVEAAGATDEVPQAADEVAERLAELQGLAGGDDGKAFYGRALDVLVLILTARGAAVLGRSKEHVEAALATVEGVSDTQRRGLTAFLDELHLVRFAGLRPERSERDGVVSRLRDLAGPVLANRDDID